MSAISFLTEVNQELKKVKFLGQKETLKLTAIVLVFSIILGLYIGSLDFSLTKFIEGLIH